MSWVDGVDVLLSAGESLVEFIEFVGDQVWAHGREIVREETGGGAKSQGGGVGFPVILQDNWIGLVGEGSWEQAADLASISD